MTLPEILLADYEYDLPDEKIARYPVEPRDTSKLMVYRNGEILHRQFTDVVNYLPPQSFLVFNNTKVIPARVFFTKPTGALIEVFLLHPEAPTRVINEAMQQTTHAVWSCMVGNKKRWKAHETLQCNLLINQLTVTVFADWADMDKNWVNFRWQVADSQPEPIELTFVEIIRALGEIPLPPYLNRKTEAQDLETYQTVYSKIEGAVAAPTAGLHFTEQVFENLANAGITHDFVTLHVGAGTFQPVKVANAIEHTMHAEQVVYRRAFIENLLVHLEGIVAVGTTSMRSLESLYWFGVKLWQNKTEVQDGFFIEKLTPYQDYTSLPSAEESLQTILAYMEHHELNEVIGETEIMIFPSYTFKLCKGLITNYHQPKSTLMLLVAAFVGPNWRTIYTEALANDYRFLSYGDSSLLLP